jgi:hypothetical protein
MIRCKHCPSTTRSTNDAARMLGWRMFQGVSQTGKLLDDVVCPSCAGTARVPDVPETWSVRCATCDWSSEDGDPDDYEAMSAKDAVACGHDHECEPWIELKSPAEGAKWTPIEAFNRDGSLRRPPDAELPSPFALVGADGEVGS